MKLTGKIALLFIGGAIAFAACKKKDDSTTTTPSKSKKDYLIEGKWQISDMPMTISYTTPLGTNTQNINQYDSMQACEKDNFVKFLTSGKIWNDEGATKCNSSDPQVDSSSTWTLNSDGTKMTFSDQGGTFDVQELTGTSMKLYNQIDTTYTVSGLTVTTSTKTTMVFKAIN
jgi:hypothetical protein